MAKSYPDKVRGPLPEGIVLDENVYVTMRDGVKIAIDIYSPKTEGRYPAILSMSPYMKEIQQQPAELSHSIEAGNTGSFVTKGYVHVIAQIRGTVFSQGQYNLFDIKEQQDGYDLVEWIAQQPWCDGNVGMLGDSYFAMIQYLVASQQPPHLKCIVPYDGATDIYRDFCNQGGVLFSHFLDLWLNDTTLQAIWPGPVDGKVPPPNLFLDIASHPDDGPYYWERSASAKLDKINIPVLNIAGGTHFLHKRGQLHSHSAIKSPKKLIVIPPCSVHAHVLFKYSKPLNEQILRYFDYWLKGINTGIMDEPQVAIVDTATREWRYENEYPLARTKWTKFYLRSNPIGKATEPPYGLISTELATRETPDSYTTPESLSQVRARKPVIAYATPPLDKDIRVWGPLSVYLSGSSTSLDTIWFAKIGDIDPDGNIKMLTRGCLKASYREVDKSRSKPGQPFHTFRNPVRPEPGRVYEYQIEMVPIFHTFGRRHKIWVQIASHDFWYQGSLYTPYVSEMLPVPTANTIYHDSLHPSYIYLPVIPDAPVIKSVEAPLSKIEWLPPELADIFE